MKRYLIINAGIVKDIIEKEKPLLASDIDGQFEQVIVDETKLYKKLEPFTLENYFAKVETLTMRASNLIDPLRYKK
jgi:hypothetical protein